MTTPGVERKVRQLDDDVISIYGMLKKITNKQTRHGKRLDELDIKIDTKFTELDIKIDNRFGDLDTRVGILNHKFDILGSNFDNLETRFGKLETKMDNKFDGLDTRMGTTEVKIVEMDGKLNQIIGLLQQR